MERSEREYWRLVGSEWNKTKIKNTKTRNSQQKKKQEQTITKNNNTKKNNAQGLNIKKTKEATNTQNKTSIMQ